MKIMLISLYDRGALGVRSLSSFLKSKGKEVSVVYFKENKPRYKKNDDNQNRGIQHLQVDQFGDDYILNYASQPSVEEIKLLLNLIKKINPQIIGLSVTTVARTTAEKLTRIIKKETGKFVIWGGIDPTTSPEECIKYPDAICIGEGFHALLELSEKIEKNQPVLKIKNLWVKNKNKVIKNSLNPLIQNLDSLPAPDFSKENKFFINDNKVIFQDSSINNDPGIYTIMTSMGCPFNCSYCCNSFLRNLYPGQKYLRRRSVKSVIGELRVAKREHDIRYVDFYDEVFTFDKKWIDEFSKVYKREIGIRFWCNVSPFFVDEDILRKLKECGLDSVTMGIQSGSERLLNQIYTRKTPLAEIERCARILYKLKIPVFFDIITNNPFEEEADCRKTFELLLRLPQRKKFMLGLAKLSFFPNTDIDKIKLDRKIIRDKEKMFEFWNRMYLLTQSYISKKMLLRISKSRYFKENPRKLNALFIFSPTALSIKIILKIREIIPADMFNYIKSVKYRLFGK